MPGQACPSLLANQECPHFPFFQDGRAARAQNPATTTKGGPMPEINGIAVLVATILSFALGALWYSPALFGKAWQREVGLTDEQLAKGNKARIFGLTFVLAFLAAWNFANFLGPRPQLAFSAVVGASAGLLWVASSFGINYLFERKSFKLFAINGGFHTLQFTIIGLVLSLLPCTDCALPACPQ